MASSSNRCSKSRHLIAEGGWSKCCPKRRPLPVTLGILYPTRRMLPPRTKSFIDLSVEEMRRHLTSQLAILGPQKQIVPAMKAEKRRALTCC